MKASCRTLRLILLCVALVFAVSCAAYAIVPPTTPRLPDFDLRVEGMAAQVAESPEQAEAVTRLKGRLAKARVSFDKVTGSPKWVWAGDEFLTGPGGRGQALPESALNAVPAGDSHRAVKAFLQEYRGIFGHGPEALAGAKVRMDTVDDTGMQTVIWQQEVDGIPVSDGTLKVHIARNGELISIGSLFAADADGGANAGTPNRKTLEANPPVAPQQAVALSATNVGIQLTAGKVNLMDSPQGAVKKQRFQATSPRAEGSLSLVWLPVDTTTMRLCWQVDLSGGPAQAYRLLVDVQSGEVVKRSNLIRYQTASSYRVYTSDSPSPFSPGWSTQNANQPAAVNRLIWNTTDPYWVTNSETIGNNTVARKYFTYDTAQATSTVPYLTFDYPLDLSQTYSTYWQASVTNLFWVCNWLHDQYYALGFTEPWGNFQTDNFGLGGTGGDPLIAFAQSDDPWPMGAMDNAFCWPEPEGTSPRIMMGIMSGPTPWRDGTLDHEMVTHEFQHAVSDRLVGGGGGLPYDGQCGALSEGWSDFFSLCVFSDPYSDFLNGNYGACFAAAGYASRLLHIDPYTNYYNYYYGFRRYPYSTAQDKSPLTYADCDDAQYNPPPTNQVPRSALWDWVQPSEVHMAGEIWCLALWDARARIIQQEGASGNQVMLQLVMDGLKLTPAYPDYLQARDAIYQADTNRYGGIHLLELQEGFAARGMGYSATSPGWGGFSGVVEAFDMPPLGTKCAAPRFNPLGCAYEGSRYVTITCDTSGASIYYTTNGSDPAGGGTLYTGPVLVSSSLTLKARATKAGMTQSDLRSHAYYIITQAATPTFDPPGGLYDSTQAVTIRCASPNATIRYTTNGTDPTTSSPVYYSPITISQNTTLKAKAWKTGLTPSAVATAVYQLKVITPVINPPSGMLAGTQTVMVTCATPSVTIRYTTNGTDPTTGSPVYTAPVSLSSNCTFKAKAWRTNWITSDTATNVYTFRAPRRWYVDTNCPRQYHNGYSWYYAFLTINDALAAAAPGDEIWVSKGSYLEQITMKNAVSIYGGFDAASYPYTFENRDWQANDTQLDAQNVGRPVTISYCSDTKTRIDGFTIQSGSADRGGGIYSTYSSPVIANCKLNYNNASLGGGAVYCDNSAATLTNNTLIYNNTQGQGGALKAYASAVKVTNNRFEGNNAVRGGAITLNQCGASASITANTIVSNTATNYGGGIDCYISSPAITNNVIKSNTAVYGGGIYLYQSSPSVFSDTISDNTASYLGGGIYCQYYSSPVVRSSIVCNNSGYGIARVSDYCMGGYTCEPTLQKNDFYDNTAANYYEMSPGATDISADPQFVNQAGEDFHLLRTSPCVDTGYTSPPPTDRDGCPRPVDGNYDGSSLPDIGAYEYGVHIGAAREYLSDWTRVAFGPLVVTAVFPDTYTGGYPWVYCERLDRAAGIRVDTYETLTVGQVVHVEGWIATDTTNGERYVYADSGYPLATGYTYSLGHLSTANRWMGGWSWSNKVPKLRLGFGYYSTGLLVQSTGKVTGIDDVNGQWFLMNDGSRPFLWDMPAGIRVILPPGGSMPSVGSYVRVKGISSAMYYNNPTMRLRALRPRTPADVETITSWTSGNISLTAGAWNYVAMPGIPQNPYPTVVFTTCPGSPYIDCEGNVTRYDAETGSWRTYFSCPDGWFGSCVIGDGFGVYIPAGGSQCFNFNRIAVNGDHLIGLPKSYGRWGYFSLIGNPFDRNLNWSTCKVTDGNTVLSLPDAVTQGWIDKVYYWTGSAWQQVTNLSTGQMQARKAYQVVQKVDGLALIVPAQ